MVEPSGAKLVRAREPLVEPAEVGHARERGHLVDDDLRLGRGDRPADRGRIEAVHDDRLRTEHAQAVELLGTAGRGDDVVPAGHQLRHEAAADRSACSCNEHTHL